MVEKNTNSQRRYALAALLVANVVVFSLTVAQLARAEWSSPTAPPPGGNVAAPINVSSAAQTKTGSLTIGGNLVAETNVLLPTPSTGLFFDSTALGPEPHIEYLGGVLYLSAGDAGDSLELQSNVRITEVDGIQSSLEIVNDTDVKTLSFRADDGAAGVDIKSNNTPLFINFDTGEDIRFGSFLNQASICLNDSGDRSTCIDEWADIGGSTGFWTQLGNLLYPNNIAWNVGIGTASPNTKLEVNSGVLNTSGVRLTQLTSTSGVVAPSGKVLSVDASGNLVLVTDAGSAGSDELVKVSGTDTTAGFLQSKLTSGDSSVTFAIVNPAGNEQLDIRAVGGGSGLWENGATANTINPLNPATTKVAIGHNSIADATRLSVKTSSANAAIYAEQSGAGPAGYFSGNVAIDGVSAGTSGLQLLDLLNCNGNSTLDTNSEGYIVCGQDQGGVGGSLWQGSSGSAINPVDRNTTRVEVGLERSTSDWLTVASNVNDEDATLYADNSSGGYAGYFEGPVNLVRGPGIFNGVGIGHLDRFTKAEPTLLVFGDDYAPLTGGDPDNVIDVRADTAAGSGSALYIEQQGTGPAAYLSGNLNVMNGKVGIGTTNPAELLLVSAPDEDNAGLEVNRYAAGLLDVDGGTGPQKGLGFLRGGSQLVAGIETNIPSGGGAHLDFFTSDVDNTLVRAVRITDTGNVGIGVAAPTQRLHVVGNARISGLVSCDTIDTDASGNLSCGSDGGGGGDSLWEGTEGSNINPQSPAATKVRIGWSGAGDSTSLSVINNSVNSAIYGQQNNAAGYAGYFSGKTVVTNGTLGIGTLAPNIGGWGSGDSVLTVEATGNGTAVIEAVGENIPAGGTYTEMDFYHNDGGTYREVAYLLVNRPSGSATRAGEFEFWTANDSGNIFERLTIDQDGNVGINNGNPAYPLHVQGDSALAGNVGIATTPGPERLRVSGDTRLEGNLTVTGLNCTGQVNGGKVTANASGNLLCADDVGGGGGGGIDGSGSVNRIAKFTDLTTLGDSILYESGGRLGINAAAATEDFQIFDTGEWAGFEYANSSNDLKIAVHSGSQVQTLQIDFDDPVFSFDTHTNADALVIEKGGDVGIGIANPTSRLHVVGDSVVSGNTFIGDSSARLYQSSGNFYINNITEAPIFFLTDGVQRAYVDRHGGIVISDTDDASIGHALLQVADSGTEFGIDNTIEGRNNSTTNFNAIAGYKAGTGVRGSGVYGELVNGMTCASGVCAGIYGSDGDGGVNKWAGYFDGPVNITGEITWEGDTFWGAQCPSQHVTVYTDVGHTTTAILDRNNCVVGDNSVKNSVTLRAISLNIGGTTYQLDNSVDGLQCQHACQAFGFEKASAECIDPETGSAQHAYRNPSNAYWQTQSTANWCQECRCYVGDSPSS